MSHSITPDILKLLEPYLERMLLKYESQRNVPRQPTLPITKDGKINVRKIADELGKRTWEQHFFRKAELASVLNAAAKYQGIKPMKSRYLADAAECTSQDSIKQPISDHMNISKQLADLITENSALKQKNVSLLEQLGVLVETGMTLQIETK